jgi:hypothetical protein
MSDIVTGEFPKKIIRMAVKLIRKYLKADAKKVEEDLKFCKNPVTKVVNRVLLAGANKLKPEYQRNAVKELGQLGLWILQKDTAYRDVFFWMLYQLLKMSNKLLPIVERYVKPPEEWTPNIWYDSKQITIDKKEQGKIPVGSKSFEETIYVPDIQEKRQAKLIKR